MTIDFAEVKRRATLPTSTVALCLAGELVESAADLERQLAALPAATSLEGSGRPALVEQLAAVKAAMVESTVDFKVRAMSARAWSLFWTRWPVRTDDEADEAWDARVFPFYVELISRSAVAPAMATDEVNELADLLHSRAWSQLVTECLRLNRTGIDIPNFEAASDLTGNSETT